MALNGEKMKKMGILSSRRRGRKKEQMVVLVKIGAKYKMNRSLLLPLVL